MNSAGGPPRFGADMRSPGNTIPLEMLIGLAGIGAHIMAFVPLVKRARLRAVSHTFLRAVDESLLSLSEIFAEDIRLPPSPAALQAFDWFAGKCPNLVKVSMARRCEEEDSDIRAEHYLTSWRVSDRGLLSLVTVGCPRLRHVNFRHCRGVTDAGISALARGCPLLEHVNLAGCKRVMDAGVQAVGEHCPRLRYLNVSCCRVTDVGIVTVAEHCSALSWLWVSRCDAVTNASIRVVALECPLLRYLNVDGCDAVTESCRQWLREKCPSAQVTGLKR
eukprot:jgi/Mesvir1/6267/Mv19976-RA.1